MNVNEQKYRHEIKYLVSTAQIPLLESRIKCLMSRDSHTGPNGIYNIRSLYFDDYDNSCFYENENGTDPREKFRIRIYNHSDKRISLECKRKICGKTQKDSCILSLQEAQGLIHGKPLLPTESTPILLRRFLIEMKTRYFRPAVIVEYERIPYIYKNGNVRVTFDTKISSSSNVNDFFEDALPKRPIMPSGQHLMEVKFDEYLPDFIYRSLNLGKLQQTTYSKYYLCRKYALNKGEANNVFL